VRGRSLTGTEYGMSFSFRWIPEKPDNGQIFTSVSYAFLPDFEAGVEYRPLVDEVYPTANWRVLKEGIRTPALILGTSNDDFGSENSQSVFASVSKHVGHYFGIGASPYAGATWIVDLEEVRLLGGLHLRYRALSTLFMYSGKDPHLTVSASHRGFSLNFILFDLELPGVGCGLRF
jgi:hypothetical protein